MPEIVKGHCQSKNWLKKINFSQKNESFKHLKVLFCLKFFLWLCLPLSVSLFSLLSYFYSPLTFLHYHCPISHYEWTVEVLVGYHLMEPLLGILLDQQPRPIYLALQSILQNLYKQMMEPIPSFKFSWVERHALPTLEDGFGRKCKQNS